MQSNNKKFMRLILSVILFFSLCGPLRGHAASPSYSKERPRGALIPYPTQQEAWIADYNDNRYLSPLKKWANEENTFKTSFTVPFAWTNRQVLLRIDSATAAYEVRVNGRTVGYNHDCSLPAEFNITRAVAEGLNNLEIILDKPSVTAPLESWRPENEAPALGKVAILSQPTMRIRDITTKTWRTRDDNDDTATAEVGVIVKSDALNPRTSRIHYELLTPDGTTAAAGHGDMTLDMRREDTLRFLVRIPDTLQWSPAHPVRYTLRLKTQHEGRYMEFLEEEIGFRTVEMRDGRPIINGAPAELRICEVNPGITEGEIMTLRIEGYNALQPLPGVVPESLYEICDREGLYVIAQAPIDSRHSGQSRRKGGNPSNDTAWQEAIIERAAESYHTSKRHPSVIAFSLARNSANGICLYEAYLHLKRLGDSRPVIYPEAAGEWDSDPLQLSPIEAPAAIFSAPPHTQEQQPLPQRHSKLRFR